MLIMAPFYSNMWNIQFGFLWLFTCISTKLMELLLNCFRVHVVWMAWLCAAWSFQMPSWNCWNTLADTSSAITGWMWWMLHIFSLPSGVVSNTVLSFIIHENPMIKYAWGVKGTLVVILHKDKLANFEVSRLCYLSGIYWFCDPSFHK